MADLIVHPLGIAVTRTYLLSRSEVTDIVGTRVAGSMVKPFPSLRLVELSTTEQIPRVFNRMLIQVDCWAVTQPGADRLARVVMAVLRDSANYITADAVMGETQDLATRSEPDSSLNPSHPRAIVTGHCWLRPSG